MLVLHTCLDVESIHFRSQRATIGNIKDRSSHLIAIYLEPNLQPVIQALQ